MRFTRCFTPYSRLNGREGDIAFDVGMNLCDIQRVCIVDSLSIDLTTTNDKYAAGQFAYRRYITHNLDPIVGELSVSRDNDAMPLGERVAQPRYDSIKRLSPHDDRMTSRQSFKMSQIGGQIPWQLTA